MIILFTLYHVYRIKIKHKKSIFFQMLVFLDILFLLNFVVRIYCVRFAFEVFIMFL